MGYEKLLNKKDFETLDSEIQNILKEPLKTLPTIEKAISISKDFDIALHPRYTLYWNEISANGLVVFFEFLLKLRVFTKKEGTNLDYSVLPLNLLAKKNLENLAVEHKIILNSIDKMKSEEESSLIILDSLNTKILFTNLGIALEDIFNYQVLKKRMDYLINFAKDNLTKTGVEIVSEKNLLLIRDKGGTYIGTRMGRPEKAKMRKQFNDETKSHGLFPVGSGDVVSIKRLGDDEENREVVQNRMKNIIHSLSNGFIEENFRLFYCEKCNKDGIYLICEVCGKHGSQKFFEKYSGMEKQVEDETSVYYKKFRLDLKNYEKDLRKILGPENPYPKHVKGITSSINKHHSTEHLCKAFFRQKHDLFVNKDGTIRFDMIEMGITHFRPFETGTSIEKLIELGYKTDIEGKPLEREEQLIEILPQDVILPDCQESGDELASDFVLNTGNYVDELLEKLYGLPSFYNFKTKADTIGHLIIGLAPHTSAGIIGRIIGYSKTQGCFSHPVWHAAQRRNLDGDENGIMMLVDGLINFSREYLPDRRGSRTMDVALVLTSHLYLDQIDDEVHGMDIVDHYPLEFYKANKEYKSPKEVKIEKIDKRIKEEDWDKRYLGYKFTHDNFDMNDTVLCSSYKSVPSMAEKLDLQLNLGRKIRAVDEHQVGEFVIDKHFMKDIKGNLRKFSMQTFRCTNCGEKYRRPPLVGKCVKCHMSNINFTIHEGSIKKYVGPSFKIVKEYNVSPYIVEVLELVNLRIESVFGKEVEKQKSLSDFW